MTPPIDFESLLRETMGLDAASVGSSTIARAVRLRMETAGVPTTEDYWRQVRNSKDELQELIETVVVPETWFYRDREAFSALARLVAEEWLPDHATGALRALSVPCSSGEEPYSIVMALLEGGLPGDRIQVDALDISERALGRARRGEYGPNSFRGEDLAFRERYFEETKSGYAVAAGLREKVTFRQANLLSPEFPPNHKTYDVIFCRNLLIYFDRSTQEGIMRTVASLLEPSGFLFVGGAETYLASRSGFTPVNRAMSFAFRKTRPVCMEPLPSLRPLPRPTVIQTIPPRPAAALKSPLPALVPPKPAAPPDGLEAARRLADAGRLYEAAEWCEKEVRQQSHSAEAWYLLGLVRSALGENEGAADCYRKLLYLDPDHMEALTHLAFLMEKRGEIAGAGRLRERARRIGLRGKEIS